MPALRGSLFESPPIPAFRGSRSEIPPMPVLRGPLFERMFFELYNFKNHPTNPRVIVYARPPPTILKPLCAKLRFGFGLKTVYFEYRLVGDLD